MKKCWIGLPLAMLVGCATPVARQESALAVRAFCCNSVRDFSYQPFVPGLEVTIKLDETAPVYDFGRGKTYFRAVRLDGGASQVLAIRSHFNGMLIGQYLQPIIAFLDDSYSLIAEGTPVLRFIRATFRVDAHMGGVVEVPQNARYAIVSTAKFDPEPDPARTGPGINVFMIGNTPVVTPSSGASYKLTRSPTGEVCLKLVNQ